MNEPCSFTHARMAGKNLEQMTLSFTSRSVDKLDRRKKN